MEKTVLHKLDNSPTLDSSVPAAFVLDSNMKFVHLNDECLHILGGVLTDYIGISILDLVPNNSIQPFKALFEEITPHNPNLSFKFKWGRTGTDGSGWFEGIYTGFFDSEGNLLYYNGIVRDIKLHRHTERLNSKIQFLLKNHNSVIFDISLKKGSVLYVSPNVQDLTGYTEEEHLSIPDLHFSIIHEEDLNQVLMMYQKIGEMGEIEMEYRIRHKGGKVKWMHAKASVLNNRFGEPIGITGLISDITSRRLSRTLFEGVLGSSLGGIFVANAVKDELDNIIDFKWLLVNRIAQETFDIKPEEFIGKTLLNTTGLEDAEKLFEFMCETHAKQSSQVINEKSLVVNGVERTFKVVADPLENSIVLTYQDITERVRSNNALKILMRDYEILFNGSIDAKFLVQVLEDNHYVYQRVNDKYTDLTGLVDKDIIGKEPIEVFGKELGSKIITKYQECIKLLSPIEFEFTAELPTGVKAMKSTLVPVFENGIVQYIAGSTRDMTDIFKQAETLRLTEAKMQSLFDSLMDTIIILDYSGNVVEYHQPENASYPHFLLDSSINTPYKSAFLSPMVKALDAAIQQISKDAKTVSFEFEVERDGERIWYLASLSKLDRLKADQMGYLILTRNISNLREKEQRLKESEEKFRDLFENANDLIQSVDIEGKFIYTNPAWHQTLGYSLDELNHLSVFDIIHPDCLEKCKDYFDQVLSGKNLRGVEINLISKEGSTIMVEGSSSCRFLDGKPFATRTIFRDISQKKIAEQEIEASRKELQKLAMVTQKTENAVLLTDLSGTIQWANPAFYNLTGNADTIINTAKYPELVVGPEMEEQDNSDIIEAIKKGKVYKGIVLHYKNDESSYWANVEIQPILDENSHEIMGSMVIEMDMTERRKIQETLTYRYEFQRALVETATSFINIPVEEMSKIIQHALSYIGSFLKVDRAYLFTYNWEKRTTSNTHEWCSQGINSQIENLNKLPNDLFPELTNNHIMGRMNLVDDVEEIKDASTFKKYLQEQEVRSQITIPLIHIDECLGFVGFDSVRQQRKWSEDEIGLLRVMAELFTNLLIRKRYETDILEAKKTAEKATSTKSKFLANMSHEIRTPMNGVIGFLDLLARTRLDEEQKSYLDEAQNASDMLMHLLNDILDISKIEADKLILEKSEFRLSDIVEKTVLLMSPLAHNKGLELNSFIDTSGINSVVGDAARLKQILTNLISNAIKFTEKGEINVRVERVQTEDNRLKTVFEVKDTGIGMEEQVVSNLFQPFVQGDSSTTRKYGGTGLGLSITKKLVELMDGEIHVASKPDIGSTFNVTLFLDIAENQQGVDAHPDFSLHKILVVDDNPTNLTIVESYLKDTGCEVVVSENPEKAINLIYSAHVSKKPFTLAILDHHMPGMDGVQLSRVIQSVPEVKSLKLILLTSMSIQDDAVAKYGLSFDGVVAKPIKRQELIGRLSRILDKDYSKSEEKVNRTSNKKIEVHIDKNASILLVEDQEVNAKLIYSFLKNNGIQCEFAVNGEEAVNKCQNNQYDLILMDCQMPVLDGFKATRMIRSTDNPNVKTPIIALTAYAMKGDREKCINAGMNDYLSKPINLDELLEKMSSLLGKAPTTRSVGIISNGDVEMISGHTAQNEVVNQFVQSTGMSKDQVLEIFELYFASLPIELKHLKEAVKSGDLSKIGNIAHKLKGTSGNLMIQSIFNPANRLEIAAKEFDMDLCVHLAGELEREALSLL